MADPHDEKHEEPAPQLGALNFLIGRFRGEGVFTDGGDPYEKDVTGSQTVIICFSTWSRESTGGRRDRVDSTGGRL